MRYRSGTMPTSKAFTGQRADAVSGLDYYGARYYDPLLGQFASADSVAQGPNRYAYVADDPETLTDPTGQRYASGSLNSDTPSTTEADWQTIVQRLKLKGTRYVPTEDIRRGEKAGRADEHVLAAAHVVADAQDQIGGIGGDEEMGYNLASMGMGVVEFYHKDSSGQWQLMSYEATDIWKSFGKDNHAEFEVLRGLGKSPGRTVASIIQAWLSQFGGQFDALHWRVDVSIVTGYPTCSPCQRQARQDMAFVNAVQSMLGPLASFNVRLYGLYVNPRDPGYSTLNQYYEGGVDTQLKGGPVDFEFPDM